MIQSVLLSFLLLDFAWWVYADRRLRPLRHARLLRGVVACFSCGLMFYVLLSLFYAGPIRKSGGLPVGVHTFIYLWHFIALPIVSVILFTMPLLRGLRAFFGLRKPIVALEKKNQGTPLPAPAALSPVTSLKPTRPSPTRRQVLAAAALAIPPMATAVASVRSVRSLYGRKTTPYQLIIPQLPRQLDGMTIAHVSDTHIGKFLNPERLPDIAREINKLDADFIAFTGDLIDLAMDDLPFGIEFLRSLEPRQLHGLVVCEGNHDIMQNRGDFEYAMRNAELPIILGEQLTLPYVSRDGRSFPVQFLAVPWNMTEPDMADAVKILRPEVNPDAFPILLAHHPHSFDAAAEARFPLVLSGHTHGGQIMLNSQVGIGSLRFRYTSGLYRKPGSSLIVNNGLGNWFPLRINAPAELVHITLRSA